MKFSAATLALLGAVSASEGKQDHKVAKISQGALESFGVSVNVEALLFCIHDEDQALIMWDLAA